MCRWVSTKPGMTIMPDASIDLGVRGLHAGADLDDPVAVDQDVRGREVTDVGVEAEHGAAADQHPSRGHDAEVDARGIQVGDLDRRRRAASDHQAPGSLVVPFHELLDVAHLEQDDPQQHQDPGDHQAVLGAKAEERERVEDQGKEDRRDGGADERRSSARQRGPAEHRGRDAAQREAVADLCVPDPGTTHDEERRERGEQAREHQRARPDPRRSDAAALRGSLVEPGRAHLESRAGGVEPVVERDGPDRDQDERDGDRSDDRVASHDVKSRSITPPGVSRSVSEIPFRMLRVASVAMIDGILSPRTRTAFTNPRTRPRPKMAPTPSSDLGGGGVGADQERGDHHAERDHGPDREVEVADEERVGLPHRHHGQRHGEEQDVGDVRPVDEPRGTASWCTRRRRRSAAAGGPPASTGGTERSCATCSCRAHRGGPSGSPAGSSRGVRSRRPCGDGPLGIATPSGERPALDRPGPRTMASTIRSSSSSSPGISSMICPRDITSTRSHRPESSSGSLDLTSRAVPASVRERNAA